MWPMPTGTLAIGLQSWHHSFANLWVSATRAHDASRFAAILCFQARTHGHDMVQSSPNSQTALAQTQGLGASSGHFMVQTLATLCLKRQLKPNNRTRPARGYPKTVYHRLGRPALLAPVPDGDDDLTACQGLDGVRIVLSRHRRCRYRCCARFHRATPGSELPPQ